MFSISIHSKQHRAEVVDRDSALYQRMAGIFARELEVVKQNKEDKQVHTSDYMNGCRRYDSDF